MNKIKSNKIDKKKKVYVAGQNGMVGSAVLKSFVEDGFENIVTTNSKELDLRDQQAVWAFFEKEQPSYVLMCAARVGGIQANIDNPATFLYDNLMIQNNIIEAANQDSVEKLVFLGSSCIYPKDSPQPMKEEYLLTGPLEPTNEGYAIAKIAGLKMVEYYRKQHGLNGISLMPCNLYGPNDHFDLHKSHVLSALVKRFVDAHDDKAPNITLWGTGVARREFMHVNDCAQAVLYMFKNYDEPGFINVGVGDDVSIKQLAETVAKKVGYNGNIEWDSTKPNGMLRKCMDVSRMKELGFVPKIPLSDGIEEMIGIYRKQKSSVQ